jgi:hypothetical protein
MSLQCFGGRSVLFDRAPLHAVARNPSRVIRSAIAIVACVVIVSGLVACRRDESAAELTSTVTGPSTTTTGSMPAPSSTTTSTLSPEEIAKLSDEDQMRYVIDRYWREWVLLGNHPDLNRESFFSLLTGDALAFQTRIIANQISQGVGWRLPENSRFSHRIGQATRTGETATVYQCVVDDAVSYVVADNKILNDDIGTVLYKNALLKAGGRWRISEMQTIDQKDGEQPCATP